jgi:hypothetical protein
MDQRNCSWEEALQTIGLAAGLQVVVIYWGIGIESYLMR